MFIIMFCMYIYVNDIAGVNPTFGNAYKLLLGFHAGTHVNVIPYIVLF